MVNSCFANRRKVENACGIWIGGFKNEGQIHVTFVCLQGASSLVVEAAAGSGNRESLIMVLYGKVSNYLEFG